MNNINYPIAGKIRDYIRCQIRDDVYDRKYYYVQKGLWVRTISVLSHAIWVFCSERVE